MGLSALYHDSAAVIIADGHILAAAQEERFTRIKHDPTFPTQAIEYCLDTAQIELEQRTAVVFYDKPLLKFERLLETYLANAPYGFGSFVRAMPIWLKEKLYFKQLLRRECRAIVHARRAKAEVTSINAQILSDKTPHVPQLAFSEHHLSHAASAFTYYCGFKVNAGEYKLMGLAPYGKPIYVAHIYRHLIDVKADGSFALTMQYFDYPPAIYPVYRCWMVIASILGFINTTVLLAVVYFLIFVPFGWVLRLSRALQYQSKRCTKTSSYYIKRDERLDKSHLHKPF